MKRRVLNLLTGLSLLLCVAVVGLWIRGYRVDEQFEWDAGQTHDRVKYAVRSYVGGVHAVRTVEVGGSLFSGATGYTGAPVTRDPAAAGLVRHWSEDYPFTDTWLDRWGFAAGRGVIPNFGLRTGGGGGLWEVRVTILVVPHWFLAALAAVPAAARLSGFVNRRALRRHGRCGACGYDLRATPDRCPECGKAAA